MCDAYVCDASMCDASVRDASVYDASVCDASVHNASVRDATVRGSHSLSARRVRWTKSSRPEGPKGGPKGRRLEVGANHHNFVKI